MSVFQIKPETFNVVYDKLSFMSKNNVCDINHCSTIFGWDSKRIYQFVKKWCRINLLSYNYVTKTEDNENDILFFESLIDIHEKREPINTYQLLKHLECIRYNIEVMEDSLEVKTLESIINDLRSTIINELPEYKNAKWE